MNKFKVGDLVKVRSLDWFKNNCKTYSDTSFYLDKESSAFTLSMQKYCNKVFKILCVYNKNNISPCFKIKYYRSNLDVV